MTILMMESQITFKFEEKMEEHTIQLLFKGEEIKTFTSNNKSKCAANEDLWKKLYGKAFYKATVVRTVKMLTKEQYENKLLKLKIKRERDRYKP